MASPDTSVPTGAMVALYPPEHFAAEAAVDGGEPPEELHCTVAYLGKASEVDRTAVINAANAVAKRFAIDAVIGGHARFVGGDTDVAVLLVDSPALEQLRRDLVDALTEADITIPAEHGYTAHITQSYLDPTAPAPIDRVDPVAVTFDYLTVRLGPDRIDIPFRPDPATVAAAAREAYAEGWASSGGPMTERVKAGCTAAVEHALSAADDPDILEATLQIGALEGLWALVFDRREQVYTNHLPAITAAWRRFVQQIDVPALVANYRRRVGLGEATEDQERRRTVAAALIVQALQSLTADPTDKQLHRLLSAVEDAIKAGHAEGVAAAIAVAAHELGHTIDFDAAYNDALEDAEKGPGNTMTGPAVATATLAARAVGQIGQGSANDMAAILAGLPDDATEDDMAAAVTAALSSDDQRAAHAYGDYAIGAAIGAAAKGLFDALMVREYDWITAGDGRVCPVCQSREENSPYDADRVPEVPAHPVCRCITVPSNPVTSLGIFLRYVMGDNG